MTDIKQLHAEFLRRDTLDEEGVKKFREAETDALISLLPKFGGTTDGTYASKRETIKAIIDAKNADAANNAADKMIVLTEKICNLTWIMAGVAILQGVMIFVELGKK